jgi:hypothetical protein
MKQFIPETRVGIFLQRLVLKIVFRDPFIGLLRRQFNVRSIGLRRVRPPFCPAFKPRPTAAVRDEQNARRTENSRDASKAGRL